MICDGEGYKEATQVDDDEWEFEATLPDERKKCKIKVKAIDNAGNEDRDTVKIKIR